jgi:hypothetical protein
MSTCSAVPFGSSLRTLMAIGRGCQHPTALAKQFSVPVEKIAHRLANLQERGFIDIGADATFRLSDHVAYQDDGEMFQLSFTGTGKPVTLTGPSGLAV